MLNVDVSYKTVLREIKGHGIKPGSPRKVPLISKINKIKQLELAEQFLMKKKSFWDSIIWSDETKINLFSSNGKKWVLKFSGENYSENTTLKPVKHGGGSIMLWGCMTSRGVSNPYIINGNMIDTSYVKFLQENLFESVFSMGFNRNFIFQQDNDPEHKSKLASQFFQKHSIEVLE